MYSQADIVIVPFPYSNLIGNKLRPVVIISNSNVNESKDVIVAQITSNLHSDEFSFKIFNTSVTSVLIYESEVRCHKLFTIDKTLIKRKISRMDDTSFKDLIEKIKSLFD
ncbi:MAG: type II toxin-antitoxin system PemK/MazF family toxin [bacterium]